MQELKRFLEFDFENPIILSLVILHVVCFLVACIFQFWVYFRFLFYKETQKNFSTPSLSVVVCGRDASRFFEQNLPLILEQKYSDFEVIVVNDTSIDDTETILAQFSEIYTNLYVTKVNQNIHHLKSKKLPLTIGIKAAHNDYVVVVDPDFKPENENWLQGLVSNLGDESQIIVGYSSHTDRGGVLSKFISFVNVLYYKRTFSYTLAGMPFRAKGQNLLYDRNLFFNNKGFASNYSLTFGDDEILVNEISNSNNCSLSLNSKTVATKDPTIIDLFREDRFRLYSKRHFKTKHRNILTLEVIFKIMLFVSFFALLSQNMDSADLIIGSSVLLSLYLLLMFVVNVFSIVKLKEFRLLFLYPLLELFYFIFRIFQFISSRIMREPTLVPRMKSRL